MLNYCTWNRFRNDMHMCVCVFWFYTHVRNGVDDRINILFNSFISRWFQLFLHFSLSSSSSSSSFMLLLLLLFCFIYFYTFRVTFDMWSDTKQINLNNSSFCLTDWQHFDRISIFFLSLELATRFAKWKEMRWKKMEIERAKINSLNPQR